MRLLHPFIRKCADINSAFCPCLLAETNHCVFCGKLQGRGVCDCDWAGVCIMYEKYWQDQVKDAASRRPTGRTTEQAVPPVLRQVGEKAYVASLEVSGALAGALGELGSFVFLRRASDPDCSHFPVGIMRTEGQSITVAIEAVGAKSTRFLLNREEDIVIRGPYTNGVLGKPWVDNLKDGKVLVAAGGIGQAPALPILARLRQNGNHVIALLAPGKVGSIFIEEEARALGVEVHTLTSLRRDGFSLLKEFWLDADLLVSAGPDDQHSGLIRFMNDAGRDLPMAATNNATMCCGEGFCGSCIKDMPDGRRIKMCKMETEYRDIMQD